MNGRLLISCPDRHGIVAAVAGFLSDSGANIVSSDQHSTDPAGGEFFMRMEFNLPSRATSRRSGAPSQRRSPSRFDMRWRLADAEPPKRVAILVSREDHCLLDLLWRHRRGELDADVALVASNHPDLAADVEGFGVPYHHVPVDRRQAGGRGELLELLRGRVRPGRARPLHADPLRRLPRALGVPVINIHHSFLPAFAGADPTSARTSAG